MAEAPKAGQATFSIELKHNLRYSIQGGIIHFNPEEQSIVVTGLGLTPDLPMDILSFMSTYGNDAVGILERATNHLRGRARALPTKTEVSTGVAGGAPKAKAEQKPGTEKKPGAEKKITESVTTIPDAVISVTTMNVRLSMPVTIKDDEFEAIFNSEDLVHTMAFSGRRKIKIFVDSTELQPQNEIEFIRYVFPTVKVKGRLVKGSSNITAEKANK